MSSYSAGTKMQQHHNHGACCNECHRVDCHQYECKREKIKPAEIPTIGDPLNCDRRNIGKHYPHDSLVKTYLFGGKRLDTPMMLFVDHSDNAMYSNGFTPVSISLADVELLVKAMFESESKRLENEYKGIIKMQQDTIQKQALLLQEGDL